MAKAKRVQKWQRDPEGMRLRILEAAKQEFAAHGLAGARVDRIATNAGANKRMLYYHVGNKEDLYLAVLEGAYEKIRSEERGLDLEHLDPPEAIERLIDFTWNYFLRNPEFLALLNTENLAKARHLTTLEPRSFGERRQGVADLLVDALEKLAAGRGAKRLKADASDTALGFFEHRGFTALQRNTVRRNGEWLANTTVEKKLDKEVP